MRPFQGRSGHPNGVPFVSPGRSPGIRFSHNECTLKGRNAFPPEPMRGYNFNLSKSVHWLTEAGGRQRQVLLFRLVPQWGQRPLQSSEQ